LARPATILALGSSLTQGYGLPPGTEFTVQLRAALKAARPGRTVLVRIIAPGGLPGLLALAVP